MTIWRKGMKAVCIKRDSWHHVIINVPADGPRFGDVLTVTRVWANCGYQVLDFAEWPNTRVGFGAGRFRPTVEPGTETGMAILRKILKTAKAPVRRKTKEPTT